MWSTTLIAQSGRIRFNCIVVPHNILLPVDFSAKEFRLEEFANAFDHLPLKHFSAFFIHDYLRLKSEALKVDRPEVQKKAESSAKKLKIDLKFIHCPGSLPSLWYQSRFADLMMLDLQAPDSAHMLNLLQTEKFFDDFACPVLLKGCKPQELDEIIFLFDHDPSGLGALKSFLSLFGDAAKDRKLTVISLNSSEGPGIYFEKSLILYLQQIFDNVGLLPMNKTDIEKNIVSYASREAKSMLIMGKTGKQLFEKEPNIKALMASEISLYYSNH